MGQCQRLFANIIELLLCYNIENTSQYSRILDVNTLRFLMSGPGHCQWLGQRGHGRAEIGAHKFKAVMNRCPRNSFGPGPPKSLSCPWLALWWCAMFPCSSGWLSRALWHVKTSVCCGTTSMVVFTPYHQVWATSWIRRQSHSGQQHN